MTLPDSACTLCASSMPTFAAVDIGSNSVRLKIARLTGGRLRAVHEDREVTRLGESTFRSGFLTPEAMAETVKVLRRFHRATQQVVTDSVRVVATSALRDARNAQAFLEWVRSATGWKVEIISGVEEARLIHLGLVSALRVAASTTLMIDLGGGSCGHCGNPPLNCLAESKPSRWASRRRAGAVGRGRVCRRRRVERKYPNGDTA